VKTSQMLPSKFLRQADVGRGVLLTITGCKEVDVSEDDKPSELKWALLFAETPKPLVLNATNILTCEHIFASDDSDHWIGKQLVAYTDPTISFGGKVVGGIRVRAPRLPAVVPPPPPPPVHPALTDEDIPF